MEDLPGDVHRRVLTSVLWGEIGITARFQVGVSIPYIYRDYKNPSLNIDTTDYGVGDARLYAKFRVVSESRFVPGVALDGFVKLPTGDEDKNLGNGETDVTIGLPVSKRFSDISVHVCPEFTFTGGDKPDLGPSADDRFNLNVGIMYHATDRLVPMLEVNSLWWGDVGDQTDIGGGVLWFPQKNTSVKVAMSRNIDADMPWSADWTPWIKLAIWF